MGAVLAGKWPIDTLVDEAALYRGATYSKRQARDGGKTALMHACACDLLNVQLGRKLFGPAVVRKFLDAGADVNVRCPGNGCNALSFAVKYGCLAVVNMLLEAGANPLILDAFGQTLLWNAAEAGDAAVIRRLLELGVDPRHEAMAPGLDIRFNIAEAMIWGSEPLNIRWKVLPPPSPKQLVQCLLVLLESGATLSTMPPSLLEPSMATGGVMVTSAVADQRKFFADECLNGDGKRKLAMAKAAEGHSARQHAVKLRNLAAARAQKAAAVAARLHRKGKQRFFDDIESVFPGPVDRGPRAMNEKQLRIECNAMQLGVTSRCAYAELQRALIEHDRTPEINKPDALQRMFVETADTNTIVRGEGRAEITMAPTHGPVQIRAVINDVPTTCFVSTANGVTTVSRSFAESVGCAFEPIDASRCAFVGSNGDALPHPNRVRELHIQLGEVKVCLTSAVAAQNFPRDIQLGLDFFRLAVRIQVDVRIGSDRGMFAQVRPDLGADCVHALVDADQVGVREELRFHAADGTTAVVPLTHTFDGINSGTVQVDADTAVDVCAHCGRHYPAMLECWHTGHERVHYCSVSCQQSLHTGHAWKLRQERQHARRRGLDAALAQSEACRQHGAGANLEAVLAKYDEVITQLWAFERDADAAWQLALCIHARADAMFQLGRHHASMEECSDAMVLLGRHNSDFDSKVSPSYREVVASVEALEARAARVAESERQAAEKSIADRAAANRAKAVQEEKDAVERERAVHAAAAKAAAAKAKVEKKEERVRAKARERAAQNERAAQRAAQQAAAAEERAAREAAARAEADRKREEEAAAERARQAERVAAIEARERKMVRRREERRLREERRRAETRAAEEREARERDAFNARIAAAVAEDARREREQMEADILTEAISASRHDARLAAQQRAREADDEARAITLSLAEVPSTTANGPAACTVTAFDGEEVCTICLEEQELDSPPLIAPFPCGIHLFHLGCAADWRKECQTKGRPWTCPVCREG